MVLLTNCEEAPRSGTLRILYGNKLSVPDTACTFASMDLLMRRSGVTKNQKVEIFYK